MYLVTGCAGFIGSNLVRKLLLKGEKVVGIDALKEGSDSNNLKGLDLEYFVNDILDEHVVDFIFEHYGVTKVIHLAAQTHVDRSLEGDKTFWETNVLGTRNLLSIAKARDVECFINQITDEVYGPIKYGYAPEGTPFNPTSPYPCSKASQYFVGKSYWETWKVPIISTFPVNCFGPYQYPEKIIPKFITRLMNNEKVPLMTSTSFQRDWLPVEDLCEALWMLSRSGEPGEDYNIGANNHCTNLELTRKLLDLCDKDESFIEIVPDRAAHDCRYAVNSNKIQKLGWESKNDFDEYLEQTVLWYQDQIGSCRVDHPRREKI